MAFPTPSPHFVEYRRLEALRLTFEGHSAEEVAKAIGASAADVTAWFDGQAVAAGAPEAPSSVRTTKRIRGDQKRLLEPFLEPMSLSVGVTVPNLRYLANWLLGVTFESEVAERALAEMGYLRTEDDVPVLDRDGRLASEPLWSREAKGKLSLLTANDKRIELAKRLDRLTQPMMLDAFSEDNLALAGKSVEPVAQELMRSVSDALVTYLRERAPSSMASVCNSCAVVASSLLTSAR